MPAKRAKINRKAKRGVTSPKRLAKNRRRTFGCGKGTIKFFGDINDPMPADWLDEFYNGSIEPPATPAGRVGREAPRGRAG